MATPCIHHSSARRCSPLQRHDRNRQKTGLTRESLYKALGVEGNPDFTTVLKVLAARDLKFVVRAA